MPLHDRDVNTVGRSNRASNMSTGPKAMTKPIPPPAVKTDMLASAPGVMSMLKASTELDTGSLMMPGSRFSAPKRDSNRQSGTLSRLSAGSSRSQQSRPISGQHGHHAWPSISSGGRRMSMTSNYSNIAAAQHYLDTFPPSLGNLSDPATLPPPAPFFRENGTRSYSLSNTSHRPGGLANYRSASSLRSHEPYPRPRSPYRYPTRLKRPGYRPASPAMSDRTVSSRTYYYHHRPGSGLRIGHGAHGSQGSFRGPSPYLHPNARLPQMYHGGRDRSSPSIASLGPLEYMPGTYPHSLPASRQGTPSIADHSLALVTPTNKAVASSTPQSSDPPSSTPPTPRNHPALSVTEPTIVTQAITPARRGSNASATMRTYYDYSEQFEPMSKENTNFLTAATITTPPSFVNRIRTILEECRAPNSPAAEDVAVGIDSRLAESVVNGNSVHELEASPVIKHITRELIRSNLLPTSDLDDSVTPSITTALKSADTIPATIVEQPTPIGNPAINDATRPHAHRQSEVSEHVSTRSDKTTATAAMEYALRYSPSSEPVEDGNTVSDFLSIYGNDERHMTTVLEEPTEPATIALAQVEVAAPTPTQPRWQPKFDTPPDMLRTQSAVVSSSVYSSTDKDSPSRYSTPLMPTPWAPSASRPLEVDGLLAKLPPPSAPEALSIDHGRNPSNHSSSNVQNVHSQEPQKGPSHPSHVPAGALEHAQVPSYSRPPSAAERNPSIKSSKPPSRPPSVADTAFGPNASMPPPRPLSMAIRASMLEAMPYGTCPPSTVDRRIRQEHGTSSRPPSAVERFSKQYQMIHPLLPSPAIAAEAETHANDAPEKSLPAFPKHMLQQIDHPVSPVSPLSEIGVTQIDVTPSPVSPLFSPELAKNKRDSNFSSIWSYRKPVPKRPDSPASISTRASIRDPQPELAVDNSGDRESTTDLRFSALGFRPVARPLDDVKEEPNLEISTVDLRSSTFKFPLPQRKSSLAHYEEFRLSRESKRKASLESARALANSRSTSPAPFDIPKPQASPLLMPPSAFTLNELRAIPSLHFSRVDLFSKLNEALDLQINQDSDESSNDLDEARADEEPTAAMRLRYRSFFESLDNMASDPAQPEGDNSKRFALLTKPPQPRKHVKLPKIQQWTPDDLMAEIDRLSIPSVGALTQRLSELLPSLKRYYGGEGDAMEDETVRSALDEIRRLGAELIPELRESGSITEEGSELYETTSAGSSSGQTTEPTVRIKHRPRSASSPGDMNITPLAELDATTAVQRSQSLSHGDAARSRDSVTASDQNRTSRRSVIGSPPESRPWNLDTSYPWANSIPPIDIGLPAPNLRREQVQPRPSRLRLHDDTIDGNRPITDIISGSVCSEITETTTVARSYTRTITHHRRTSKHSLLGSVSRKIGLPRGVSIDNSGYATGPDILRGAEDRAVDPGDRYPTTGLSPPSALNIDEVRSFFSDDSGEFETQATSRGGGGMRKRLSNLRTRFPAVSRTHSALDQRPMTALGPAIRRSNSLFLARSSPRTTVEFDLRIDEAAGMPKTEVRAKKLVNRMKSLWYRGGELLRSLSGKRRVRESQDWDDDGLSAVWEHA